MSRISKDPHERRSELIACAQNLFYANGYEKTSVSDIVNEVGVAKGTFYYYFDSKQAILEAMVDELIAYSVALIRPIIDDPTLNATEKWNKAFRIVGSWKADRKSEMIALMQMMQSDENVLLRYKIHMRTVENIAAELARVVDQGVDEGVFNTEFGEDSARIALASSLSLADMMYDLMLSPEKYEDPAAVARQKLSAVQTAIERVLGAEPGSLPLADQHVFDVWFSGEKVSQMKEVS